MSLAAAYMFGRNNLTAEQWATDTVVSYRALNPEQVTWFDLNPSIETELFDRLLLLFPTFRNQTDASFIYLMQVSGNTTSGIVSKTGNILRWDMQGQIFNQNNLPAATLLNNDIITVTSEDGWDGLTTVQFSSKNLKGYCPTFNFANVSFFTINSNQFTGVCPNFIFPNVQFFRVNSNQFTGVCPNFNFSNVELFYILSNNFTSIAGFSFVNINLGDIRVDINALNQTSIDGLLSETVAANKISGTRSLKAEGGTNAAPSATGTTDKNTLISRGWTVTTN
tara:strand:- start:328 stop:1167 length:840 start_codon:yes stop_codon:yes gene_type:complete